jgi:hypothetical protein
MNAISYVRPMLADHGTARIRTRGVGSVTLESGGKPAPLADVSTNNGGATKSGSETTSGG